MKWHAVATSLVRPGAEAVLLAGVAFGCAQIGWRLIAPETAEATAVPASLDVAASDIMADFQSPFSPARPAATTAVPDVIAGIHLVGVRMSERANLSGAVLTFGDDLQRPYLVGHEISDGVRLAAVHSDHIVVSFADDEQVIVLDQNAPPSRSFALALMGVSPQPDAPPVEGTVSMARNAAAQTVSLSDAARSPANTQWLLSTMSSVETRNGAAYGWRVSSPPPALSERGLATGDVILSINGARPGDAAAVLAAARSSQIKLAIEHASGERETIVFANGLAS